MGARFAPAPVQSAATALSSSVDCCEYVAYYHTQPLGLWREDFRFAYLLMALARMLGSQGQAAADFMPFYQSNETYEAQQEMQQAIEAIFSGIHVVHI